MTDHFGHTGSRLRVDLTDRTARIEEISDDYARAWMGGRGYNMEVFSVRSTRRRKPVWP